MLVSGSGTLLPALLRRVRATRSTASASPRSGRTGRAPGSSGPNGPAYRRSWCRPTEFVDRAAWDVALAAQVGFRVPRFVVTAGFMRILGPVTLGARPVVDAHPALLPSFPGAHGVRDALAYGVKVTGATCHVVDAGVDTGPIIEQRVVAVEDDNTEESLHERIKVQERDLLVDVVGRLAREGFSSWADKFGSVPGLLPPTARLVAHDWRGWDTAGE